MNLRIDLKEITAGARPAELIFAAVFTVLAAIIGQVWRRKGGQFALLVAGTAGLKAIAPWFYLLVFRPWHLRWGARGHEFDGRLPGDELIPHPNTLNATRAITIDAPADVVWPWLVQMGFDRAGWYSYDLFDNLGRRSADRILPEHQRLEVGDLIPTGPRDGVKVGGFRAMPPERGFRVAMLEPNRLLVLSSRGMGDWRHPEPTASWGFYLEPLEGERTRLIERIRGAGPAGLLDAPTNLFWEIVDFLMMRRQLMGIKERAERLFRQELAAGRTSSS